jgi:sulfoxide reductase heme-binding subunit YedZ
MVLVPSATAKRFVWVGIFALMTAPAIGLFYLASTNQLGADPAKEIVDELGQWAIRLLIITLCASTFSRRLNIRVLLQHRRMLGLFALFYALLHLFAVSTFILGWRVDLLIRELTDRPYIMLGMASLLLLIPLGVTSTKGWQKRLGRRWTALHTLIYPATLLALLHLVLLIRASVLEAIIYTLLILALLTERLFRKRKPKKQKVV